MKGLIQKFTALLTSLITVLVWIGINSHSAKANEVRTFSKNNISLNANDIYGSKDGHTKVSQFTTSNYRDDEQLFEVIPLGGDKNLLRSIAKDKCVNSYLTAVGTTPNLYPCDANDQDQQMIVHGDDIIHAATGLQLNLGQRNDTPVVWINPNSNSLIQGNSESKQKSFIPGGYIDEVESKPQTLNINACPEIKREVIRKPGDYLQIDHVNACGKFYTYLNRNAIISKTADARNVVIGLTTFGGLSTIATQLGIEMMTGYGIPIAAGTLISLAHTGVLASNLQSCMEQNSTGAWVNIYLGLASYENNSIAPSFEVTCTF
jgi:hypothetical protein